jgi:hypothetical protein
VVGSILVALKGPRVRLTLPFCHFVPADAPWDSPRTRRRPTHRLSAAV